jgi:hypothetical protein
MRAGSAPPSACRRAMRYSYSSDWKPGCVRWQLVLQERVGDRQLEAIPERLQLGLAHLLHLVGGVTGFEVGPERPAFDGVGQDHGRRAAIVERFAIGGVDLAGAVAAAAQPAEVIVAEVPDERR